MVATFPEIPEDTSHLIPRPVFEALPPTVKQQFFLT